MLLFAFLVEELRIAYAGEKEPVEQGRLKIQARKKQRSKLSEKTRKDSVQNIQVRDWLSIGEDSSVAGRCGREKFPMEFLSEECSAKGRI